MEPVLWPGWQTVRLLGAGSYGEVYEIERNVIGITEKAAVKHIGIPQKPADVDTLYVKAYDTEDVVSNFNRRLQDVMAEYSLMQAMRSQNVVRFDDIRCVQRGEGIGWDVYIKMELLTPITRALPEQIPEQTVVDLARDICRALIQCEEYNIIHRDVKPESVFLSADGRFKLGDFVVARAMGNLGIESDKYMAPEVFRSQPCGPSTDVYSLGMVLYWMLNRRQMPFTPLPPAVIDPSTATMAQARRLSGEPLPPPADGSVPLKQIILKATAFDPAERFQSAREMLAALDGLLQKNPPAYAPAMIPGFVDPNALAQFTPQIMPEDEDPQEILSLEKREKLLRILLVAIGLALLAVLVAGFFTVHKWKPATCAVPETCAFCKKTRGSALGHSWQDATCTAPETCVRCGKTKGIALGHDWQDATCTAPEICRRCGEVGEAALGHDWAPATDSELSTCRRCGIQRGNLKGIREGDELDCYLSDSEVTLNDQSGRFLILYTPLEQCVQLELQYRLSSYTANPYGQYAVFAKDKSENWNEIGRFTLDSSYYQVFKSVSLTISPAADIYALFVKMVNPPDGYKVSSSFYVSSAQVRED